LWQCIPADGSAEPIKAPWPFGLWSHESDTAASWKEQENSQTVCAHIEKGETAKTSHSTSKFRQLADIAIAT
jgi:hypothetical protein